MSQQSSPPSYNGYITEDSNLRYAFNSRVMVAAIIVLFLVILFILMLHVYAKWFWHHSSRSIIIRRGLTPRSAVQPAINTGLDAATIAQLPAFFYKSHSAFSANNLEAGKDESMVPLLECAVCLSEFQENDKVRLLPSCQHTFHTECIDMWFFSHSTCPLCRKVVLPATAALPANEQHQGEAAMEASHNTEDNHVSSNAVQFPCNVLFWGNEAQVASTQEPSSSTSTSTSAHPRTRVLPLPQITINIPAAEGGVVLTISTPGRRSAKSADQACSSQTLKSPGLRASFKRMLSRQSSRHVEGNEGSDPK